MIICPKCGTQMNDGTAFCKNCGTPVGMAAGQPQMGQPQMGMNQAAYQQPAFDPYDHTAEFSAKDISDNKVIAMLPYLFSWIGVVLVLLASKESPYASFHVRQYLKVLVTQAVLGLLTVACVIVLIIPFLGWIVGGLGIIAIGIMNIILSVVTIIGFFSVCKGNAKELPIVRGLKFLK